MASKNWLLSGSGGGGGVGGDLPAMPSPEPVRIAQRSRALNFQQQQQQQQRAVPSPISRAAPTPLSHNFQYGSPQTYRPPSKMVEPSNMDNSFQFSLVPPTPRNSSLNSSTYQPYSAPLHVSSTPDTRSFLRSSSRGAASSANTPRSVRGNRAVDEQMLSEDLIVRTRSPTDALIDGFCVVVKDSTTTPFDRAQEYQDLCQNRIRELERGISATGNTRMMGTSIDQLTLLKKESDTWRLLTTVYHDRWTTRHAEEKGNDNPPLTGMSDKEIVAHILDSNPNLRQAVAVIAWLESCSLAGYEQFVGDDENYESENVSWQETLHRLKAKKRGMASFGTRQDVTQLMDADAPLRTKKALDEVDQADEERLLKKVFTLLRTGRLDKAKELCRRCGQPWRAATLQGSELWHDPNAHSDSLDEHEIEGTWFRDSWKATCIKMSEDPDLTAYERASYAALCGNLSPLLRVCTNWDDALWAHFKVLVDVRIERELRRYNHPQRGELVPLPPAYDQDEMDPQLIFSQLEASHSDAIREGSEDKFHQAQSLIILDKISTLIKQAWEWISTDATASKDSFLRMMAHIILFLRSVDEPLPPKETEAILSAYVNLLIHKKCTSVIAIYTGHLERDTQVSSYASFIQSITDREAQLHSLKLAEEAGLDVAKITKQVVECIRGDESRAVKPEIQPSSSRSEHDQTKIDAIDWLIFDPSQRAEALIQASALMRGFLGVKKVDAALNVFTKLPSDSVAVIKQYWSQQMGDEELPADVQSAIKEYLCIQALLDAQEAFNTWFYHVTHMRPVAPAGEGSSSVTMQERIQRSHEQEQYEHARRRYELTRDNHIELVVSKTWNVFLFPGGWLMDPEAIQGSPRAAQLMLLRKIWIPELCFCLHRVLHEAERFQECVQLADIIVSESGGLLEVFQGCQDETRKILNLIRTSAMSLLNTNVDPIGYLKVDTHRRK